MEKKKEHKQHQVGKKATPKLAKVTGPERWKYYVALAIIVLISFIAYLPVFQNGFVWDDEFYIKNNTLIYSINLNEIFSQNVMGNYHPLTILALAVEYHFFGLDATGYHAVNLLLHLLNVVLVFYAVFHLSNKAGIALVASLLFGIHPIHVESVAWVAELKDLLYAFFFLASYIFYLKYFKERHKKFYAVSLLLFTAALLSKAMAASLPVVLILTDYFRGRKIDAKALLEKAPFFLLAVIFGIVAVTAQRSLGAVHDLPVSFPQRIIFACYGFIMYLVKLLFPLRLSAFYPYPMLNAGAVPAIYYVYLLFFAGLAFIVYYSIRLTKEIIFGLGFFAITVFLVLQLLPVGGAIMADRYCYIPSIGIFYLAGVGCDLLWTCKRKVAAIILLSAFAIFFSIRTYTKCGVWKNDMTLWNNVIIQYQTVSEAYYNRGNQLRMEKRYEEALKDYNKAIELKSDDAEAYNNRGSLLKNLSRRDEALKDYNKAIKLNPDFAKAYNNRGILLKNLNRSDEALNDYNKAIELNPDFAEAYNNRGNLLKNLNRHVEALDDYNKAIELNPDDAEAHNNRGSLLKNLNRSDEALIDFNKAIEQNPTYAEAYNNLGTLLYDEKKFEEAIRNFTRAIALKADYALAYYNRGIAEYYSSKNDAACLDMKQAANLGYNPATDALSQVCK